MADVLLRCRRAVQLQLDDVQAVLTAVAALLADDPPADSHLASVHDFCRRRSSEDERVGLLLVLEQDIRAVQKVLWNVRDHALAFQQALEASSGLTTSLQTLVRGMFEGALLIAHLTEPVAPALFLARGHALRLAAMEGSLNTVLQFPTGLQPDSDGMRDALKGMYGWSSHVGFVRQAQKGAEWRTSRVSLDGQAADLKVTVTALHQRFLPKDSHLYPLLSGPAHSALWYLEGSFQLDDEEGDYATVEQSQLSAVTTALEVSDLLVQALTGPVGMDPSECVHRTHFRRRALLAASNGKFSPLGYEDYHARPWGKTGSIGTAFTRQH